MTWLLILLAVFGVWTFFNANLLWRNKGRSDLGHAIRSLLMLMEDGGWLSIKQHRSPAKMRITRRPGESPTTARLILQIPWESWSESHVDDLRKLCDAHSYDATFRVNREDSPLVEIQLMSPDIWSPSAGAPGARLTNLVLDAVGVQPEARFKLALVGHRSRRFLDRERALRKNAES